jgi:hypothetical protein
MTGLDAGLPRRTVRRSPPAPASDGIGIAARPVWGDVLVVLVLVAIAAAGFVPAFGATSLVAAGGGLLVGGGAAVLARLLRLPLVAAVALAIAAYFVFGTACALPGESIAGAVPTLDSLSDLASGAVFGWRDAVTLHTPLEAPPAVSALPYVAAWFGSAFSVTALVRLGPTGRTWVLRVVLGLAGPAAVFLATILLGTREPFFAGARGVAFGAIALIWLGWCARTAHPSAVRDAGLTRTAITGGAIVVVAAVAVGTLTGVLAHPSSSSRIVVRDEVQPPFDPLDYPAPLAGFRKYTKQLEKTKLFTITGLHDGQRVRLAAMDSYDGVVWSVTSPRGQGGASGAFELYGREIPAPRLFTGSTTTRATVTIDGYDDVWLPTLGYAQALSFQGAGAGGDARGMRVNVQSGSAAVMTGVSSGMRYTIEATAQKVPSDTALKDVAVANVSTSQVTGIPDIVGQKADEYAGNGDSAIGKLRSVERSLKKLGYLSHGRASDSVPSRAGEGADRITDLLTRSPMVGDEEQYATVFALMARHLGFAARVVMGFAPSVSDSSSTTSVTGGDITAWVEVPFDGVGWVPFFPTPDKTDAPNEQTTKPKIEPQPQVRQPPETKHKTDDLLTPVKTQDEAQKKKKDTDHAFVIPVWAYYAAGGVLLLVLVFVVPFLIVAARKRARRRRRRGGTGDSAAAGAWDELLDRYAELGLAPPTKATRRQIAAELERQCAAQKLPVPEGGLSSLAGEIDAAVFDGTVVADDRAGSLWRRADSAAAVAANGAGWLRRRFSDYRLARPGRTSSV